jgi:hypothetical protein
VSDTGPKWSKKQKLPTARFLARGNIRRTSNPGDNVVVFPVITVLDDADGGGGGDDASRVVVIF